MNRIKLVVFLMAMLGAGQVWGGEQTIQKGSTIKLDYTLTVDGQVIDTSEGKTPLQYIHGQEMLITGLERALEGLKPGDQKKISVSPEDGYGTVNANAFAELPKDQIEGGDFKVGGRLTLEGPDGRVINGVVAEIKASSIVVDFNHPLAGKVLDFDVKIVGVEGP